MTAKRGAPENFIAERRIKYSKSSSSCKVFTTSLLRESVAVLCSAAGNKFLFSNENKLVRSWWPRSIETIFPNSEKTNSADASIRLRKVLSPFLSPDSLRKHLSIMDTVAKHHLDIFWSHQKQVKVLSLTKKYTFVLVCKIFLNVEDPQVIAKLEEPMQHIAAGFISLPINLPGTAFNRAIRSAKQVKKEIEEIVRQRRIDLDQHAADQDLLSKLLMGTYSDGQQIKDTDIANELNGLFIAAYDNVFITLCSIIMYLSEYPQVYDAVLKGT
jgi:cytochrome P450 family 26 subfamily A